MYLNKKTYVQQWDHQSPEDKFHVTVKKGSTIYKGIKPTRVTYIVEQVGYWRKSNHIHQWFVDNCQNGEDDCRESYVPHDKLKELLNTCKEVLTAHNAEKSAFLLPTQSGFFFGSTDYDQYYYEDTAETVRMLTDILTEDPGGDGEYYYQSSW